MKDVKIFCYCLGGWFTFGTVIAYAVLSMFDFISGIDSNVASDPVFGFMMRIINDMLSYCYYLLVFGVGYIALGYFLEKLGKNALLIHVALSAGLIIWAIIFAMNMYPKVMSFAELIPDQNIDFLEQWNRFSLGIGLVMGSIQFVFPQFFLGRLIWKKTYKLAEASTDYK